jgi:hypothetical protein
MEGNADREFNKMDRYVLTAYVALAIPAWRTKIHEAAALCQNSALSDGSAQVHGTVKYPARATPRRSWLSRMPENGMHGLKGDAMDTAQPS